MECLFEGKGTLFSDPDPDKARDFLRHKSRILKDKTTDIRSAIKEHVTPGSYLAIGGFGGVRVPVAAMHEIVRQGIKGLKLSGHTATHDFQILSAGECFDKCDVAYVVGLEARGVSKNARKYLESGKVECTEWTNAGMAWRFKAAALGIPFLIGRQSLGSDGIKWSASKVITCPYTGKKFATFPALYPDITIIHVHEADIYGNALIRGITIVDDDLARASKRLIITCERIVPIEKFRDNPNLASIPYFCVDAVCEVPYGSYPGNMAYEYFSDEEHIKEWLDIEEDPEDFKKFLQKNIYGVKDFNEYLNLHGGLKKMQELRDKECLIG
ncbi:MAG: glutaconate CoA-transferase [Deltaproteobacteria bacterium CG11_big_fil_rev_8_21_14_0_20_49_13]|nr:MAG: glutaconate CoA-transferase [Deltaproteobacteria bacterium CG11_big_fil_rev_8_21_14_0_20_49_13]